MFLKEYYKCLFSNIEFIGQIHDTPKEEYECKYYYLVFLIVNSRKRNKFSNKNCCVRKTITYNSKYENIIRYERVDIMKLTQNSYDSFGSLSLYIARINKPRKVKYVTYEFKNNFVNAHRNILKLKELKLFSAVKIRSNMNFSLVTLVPLKYNKFGDVRKQLLSILEYMKNKDPKNEDFIRRDNFNIYNIIWRHKFPIMHNHGDVIILNIVTSDGYR